MPAPSRSTCHGHQHLPGSGEQWKQADTGPGRSTLTPVLGETNRIPGDTSAACSCMVCPKRHPVPPSALSSPKCVGSLATLQEPVASWEAQRAGCPLGTKKHPGITCPLLQGRVLQSVHPCPERLWDRQNLHCLTPASHPQPVHEDYTGWRCLLSLVSLC